jgi:hypothetical protein
LSEDTRFYDTQAGMEADDGSDVDEKALEPWDSTSCAGIAFAYLLTNQKQCQAPSSFLAFRNILKFYLPKTKNLFNLPQQKTTSSFLQYE